MLGGQSPLTATCYAVDTKIEGCWRKRFWFRVDVHVPMIRYLLKFLYDRIEHFGSSEVNRIESLVLRWWHMGTSKRSEVECGSYQRNWKGSKGSGAEQARSLFGRGETLFRSRSALIQKELSSRSGREALTGAALPYRCQQLQLALTCMMHLQPGISISISDTPCDDLSRSQRCVQHHDTSASASFDAALTSPCNILDGGMHIVSCWLWPPSEHRPTGPVCVVGRLPAASISRAEGAFGRLCLAPDDQQPTVSHARSQVRIQVNMIDSGVCTIRSKPFGRSCSWVPLATATRIWATRHP